VSSMRGALPSSGVVGRSALLIGGVVPFTFIEHHVYEQGITCAGSRSRYSGDAFFARALGEASRGENGA
jgi:hypothetical protein